MTTAVFFGWSDELSSRIQKAFVRSHKVIFIIFISMIKKYDREKTNTVLVSDL